MQTTTPNSVVQWIKPRLSGIHHKCLYSLRPLETHNSFFLKICHRSQEVTAYISSRALAAHWGWEGGGLESPSQGSGARLPQLYFIARLIGLLVSFTMRVIVTCSLARGSALMILIQILAVKLSASPVNSSYFIVSFTVLHTVFKEYHTRLDEDQES